jgi:hypothetical protein
MGSIINQFLLAACCNSICACVASAIRVFAIRVLFIRVRVIRVIEPINGFSAARMRWCIRCNHAVIHSVNVSEIGVAGPGVIPYIGRALPAPPPVHDSGCGLSQCPPAPVLHRRRRAPTPGPPPEPSLLRPTAGPEPRRTTSLRRASCLCALRAVGSGALTSSDAYSLNLSAPPRCMVRAQPTGSGSHAVLPGVSE